MTFDKINIIDFELISVCNKLGVNVIGGFNKLFDYFVKNYDVLFMKAFIDRRWNNQKLYKGLGFKLNHVSMPDFFYIIDKERRKKIEHENDIDIIWDCGKYLFCYDKSD